MSLRYEDIDDLPPAMRAQAEKQMQRRSPGHCAEEQRHTAPGCRPPPGRHPAGPQWTPPKQATESEEQQAVMAWAQAHQGRWPQLRLLHHIPNGGGRTKAQAGLLKAEGVKAGVPDLCLPVARKGYHGLYIEMKAKTGKTSWAQRQWIHDLKAEGYLAMVCHGCAQAVQTLEEYLHEGRKEG